MSDDVWGYRETSGRLRDIDLTGFKVEATDGHIGKVDKHSDVVGASYLVVDTGHWIFGKEVLLPAGTVTRIDQDEQRIHVDRTKAQIKDAPEFVSDRHLTDAEYHRQVGAYYTGGPEHRA
ncbi:PRC-barrel domain-containing protein [Streptomyces sp. NPDC002039]|uniref:PRC-barrel domain-containing protein n=1 Tax=unclassified Streptomyces TaxID=2593676 RepID=UPI00331D980F